MNALLQAVTDSPKLPALVQELESLLAVERERRQRFYEELTEQFKAEFINGQVVMHSPARHGHCLTVGYLYNLLHNHISRRQLGKVLFEKTLICLTRNDDEPD